MSTTKILAGTLRKINTKAPREGHHEAICVGAFARLCRRGCNGFSARLRWREPDHTGKARSLEERQINIQLATPPDDAGTNELEARIEALGFRRVVSHVVNGHLYWTIEPLSIVSPADPEALHFLTEVTSVDYPSASTVASALPGQKSGVSPRAQPSAAASRTKARLKFVLAPRPDLPFTCRFSDEFDSHEEVFNRCNQWMQQNSGGTARVANQVAVSGIHRHEGLPQRTVFESQSLVNGVYRLQSGFEQYSQFSRAVCSDGEKVVEEVENTATGFNHTYWCEQEPAEPDHLPPDIEGGGDQAGQCTSHPIFPASGEKVFQAEDARDQAPHPLRFERTYRTQWQIVPRAGMGALWGHNHSATLRWAPSDASGNTLILQLPDGTQRRFVRSGSSAPWRNASHTDTLVSATTNSGALAWRYGRTADDSQWLFSQPTASSIGRLETQRQRDGWTYAYTYNPAGQLTQVRNQFNRTLTLSYHTGSALLASVRGPDGATTTYSWDADARLTRVTQSDNTHLTYLYENPGYPQHITGITDENGARYQTVVYDSLGRATLSTFAGNAERYSVGYASATSGLNAQATITDPLGTARSFGYTQTNGHTDVTSGSSLPGCKGEAPIASRTQTAQGLLASETDFQGSVTRYTWDASRQLIRSITQAAGTPEQQITTVEWHPTFSLPSLVTTPLRTTAYSYDASSRILTSTVTHTGGTTTGKAQTTRFTYTSTGLLATRTESNGAVTTFGNHTSAGLPQTITNPLGHVTSVLYDSGGRPTRITQPDGLVRALAYFPRGWLKSSSATANGVTLSTAYTYTPSGQVKTASLPNGHVVTYSHDLAQRVTGWTDNRGQSAAYTLDGLGNIAEEQIRNSGGAVALQISRNVNAINRLSRQTLGDNQTSTYAYDANGRLQSITDAANARTRFGLDALARTTQITNALGNTAQLGYDSQNALINARDFKGVSTSFAPDAQGLPSTENSPDVGRITSAFDSMNLPIGVTDSLGRATSIERDLLGRPTLITYRPAAGATHEKPLTTELRYDLTGSACNISGHTNASKGRLCEMVDKVDGVLHATTQYQWDAFGRLRKQTQTLSSAIANHSTTRTTSYAYLTSGGGKGEISTITYPSGGILTHKYNVAGRLTTMLWGGKNLLQTITYNALDQPLSWTWAFADSSSTTALSATRQYNTAGQLTSSEFATFAPEPTGRIGSLTQKLMKSNGTGTWAEESVPFSALYNPLGQLTSLQAQGTSAALQWRHSYGYDANGNRTSATVSQGGNTSSPAYAIASGSNRLTISSSSPVATNAAGEITSLSGLTLGYDSAGRLSQAGTGELSTINRFNGRHQRFLRDTPDAQTIFSYGIDGFNLLSQTSRNLSTAALSTTEHIYLPTSAGPMPVAVIINGVHLAVHSDHLNTPRRLSDPKKIVKWQWPYSGFGEIAPQATPAAGQAPVSYSLRYPGQVDDGNGLFYNWHRFYQPQTGRYTQADPVGLDAGWNRFAYVGGNPLSRTDPYGLAEYFGLHKIEDHLRWLARIQGADFDTDPFDAPNREMLSRLRRGEESPWDIAFYRHEMAEDALCRPARGLPLEQALKVQKQSHESVMRKQQNSERALYHPDVVFRNRSVFGKDW